MDHIEHRAGLRHHIPERHVYTDRQHELLDGHDIRQHHSQYRDTHHRYIPHRIDHHLRPDSVRFDINGRSQCIGRYSQCIGCIQLDKSLPCTQRGHNVRRGNLYTDEPVELHDGLGAGKHNG